MKDKKKIKNAIETILIKYGDISKQLMNHPNFQNAINAFINTLSVLPEQKIGENKMKKSELREIIREVIKEKWEDEIEVKPTGEHAGKTVAQLKKELEALKGKKPYNRELAGELMFAIRAKTGWKKGEGAVTGKK